MILILERSDRFSQVYVEFINMGSAEKRMVTGITGKSKEKLVFFAHPLCSKKQT
jgi:hypothetical protein